MSANISSKIPPEFRIKSNQCKAMTDEKGILSKLPPIAKTISPQHYSLLCVINKNKPICTYSSSDYIYCPNKLINNIKIQLLSTKFKVQTILIKRDKQGVENYICYLNPEYEDRAHICAYINKLIIDSSPDEMAKMHSFSQPYNYILGYLYGYSEKEIRGYYLQRYLLKSLPPKIKSKMMKYIEESNFDLDFVSYKVKLERLYKALKKVDNFKDFDEKFAQIKIRANITEKEIVSSNKFKAFRRSVKPKLLKFSISDLKTTYPDDYKKLAPQFTKFQKSLK